MTLIEVLVSISIISILVGLLLPAAQGARESARRVQCADQIRQLALSTHSFHSSHRTLPNNGGRADDNFIISVEGNRVQPFTRDFGAGLVGYWGIADPARMPSDQTGPWCFSLMPFLELQSLHQANTFVNQVAIFNCPSRSRGGPALAPLVDAYGNYESGGHAMAKTDYVGNSQLIVNRPKSLRMRDIFDGSSQTILYGEKAFDPIVQSVTSWFWDEPIYIGGSHGTVRDGLKILTDKTGISFRHHWGSAHRGLCHFAFADGHVDSLSNSTDEKLLASLLTPQGSDN